MNEPAVIGKDRVGVPLHEGDWVLNDQGKIHCLFPTEGTLLAVYIAYAVEMRMARGRWATNGVPTMIRLYDNVVVERAALPTTLRERQELYVLKLAKAKQAAGGWGVGSGRTSRGWEGAANG